MSEPQLERHKHWTFIAWHGDPPRFDEATKLHFACEVTVVGYENESDALIAAREIVDRPQFMLRSVYECQSCGFQNQTAQGMRELVKAATR